MKPLVRAAVLAVVVPVALTGCGPDTKEKAVVPSPGAAPSDVSVPSGTALSPYGSELKFGDTATVGYAPNSNRASVLKLTVVSVTQGSVAKDLGGYSLNDRMRQSTPFYVQVDVENVGIGDVGKTPVPLFLEDNRKALIGPSTFTDNFTKCPSKPFPTTFAPKAKARFCLVYLTPNRGTFSAMSFRPSQANNPIRWTGALTVPAKTSKGKAS
ncbi:MAG: hypothetical protein NTV23_15200 [Propionibacteriales bacterium]|nr:hypothetical protein [Propionibacteriales bacterium]